MGGGDRGKNGLKSAHEAFARLEPWLCTVIVCKSSCVAKRGSGQMIENPDSSDVLPISTPPPPEMIDGGPLKG